MPQMTSSQTAARAAGPMAREIDERSCVPKASMRSEAPARHAKHAPDEVKPAKHVDVQPHGGGPRVSLSPRYRRGNSAHETRGLTQSTPQVVSRRKTSRRSASGSREERGVHAGDDLRHVHEIDGDVGRTWRGGGHRVRLRSGGPADRPGVCQMSRRCPTPVGALQSAGPRHAGIAEEIELVRHGKSRQAQRAPSDSSSSRREASSSGVEIDRGVAFVAEHLDQRRPALFLRRLELAVSHPHQVHLQRFHKEVLRVPAVRTRQRQNSLSDGPKTAGPARAYRSRLGDLEKNPDYFVVWHTATRRFTRLARSPSALSA